MAIVTENHSQWRGEEENQNRLLKMYALALPLCDGKNIEAHKACVATIRKEYSNRFHDRYKAYYTAKSAESLLATAVILSYLSEDTATTDNKTAQPKPAKRNLVCSTHQFSSNLSVSLSSFTVIPVTCN